MQIKYFHNGTKVSEAKAKEIALAGYSGKGYADLEEFTSTWSAAQTENGEVQRDFIFDWSDYSLEIEV